jgi:hypothetical protein
MSFLGTNLDDELREALRREPAPVDFTARVLAKVPVKTVAIPFWRRPVAALAMAAGLMAALIPPAISAYHRRQEAQAMEARRELLVALSITRATLIQARAKLQHASIRSTPGHTL